MKQMKSEKGFAWILPLLLIGLLAAGVIYSRSYLLGSNFPFYKNNTSMMEGVNISDQSVLEGLKSALPIKTDNIEDSTYEWMISYKKLVPLKGQGFGASNADTGSLKSKITVEPVIYKYFTGLGFVKDEVNTLNTLDSGTNLAQQSYGFTKETTKCIVIFNSNSYDGSEGWSFFCGKIDDNAEKLREEFTAVFEARDAKNPKAIVLGSDTASVITVKQVLGNYARGRVDTYLKGVYLPSGGAWVAVKINGQWQIIHSGQDYNQCSVFDKYNVPVEIYKNCYLNFSDSTPRFKTH